MKKLFLLLCICYPGIFFAQTGRVGINTTAPLAMLHVKDSSVVFSGAEDVNNNPGPVPISGSGVRMMWYPDMAAFRTGRAENDSWDKENIGKYSFAAGQMIIASGLASVALGQYSKAGGHVSFAAGEGAYAQGGHSYAMGLNAWAAGHFSYALGEGARASGICAFAIGAGAKAEAYGAQAIGHFVTALGEFSNSIGTLSIAEGHFSNAIGYLSMARGVFSTALGNGTQTNTNGSIAIGSFNDTIIPLQETIDNNTPLFIVGNGLDDATRSNALVVNYGGHMGIGTNFPTHKLDVKVSAPGAQIARFSSDGGYGEILVDNSIHQVDLGMRPEGGYVGSKDSINFFIRARGIERIAVDHQHGHVGIGTLYPSAKLVVKDPLSDRIIARFGNEGGYGEIQVSNSIKTVDLGTTSDWGYVGTKSHTDFIIRTGTFSRMAFQHSTGNVGIATTTPTNTLEVNGTAGKPGGGSWIAASDSRLKQNVTAYTDGLSSLLQIHPVSYQYNTASGYDTGRQHIGIIAQELQQVAPYMVSTSSREAEDGSENYLEVDNSAMVYMLINAVKEQQAIISQLEQRIAHLEIK